MNINTLLSAGLLLLSWQAMATPPAAPTMPKMDSSVEFLANRNQWEPAVLFAANVPGGRLFLTPGRLVQARYDVAGVEAVHDHERSANGPIKAHAYGVTFVGANAQAAVQGENQRSAHTSFFLGNDPKKWASNVPAFGAVRYQALYPGTDLRLYSRENQVEYDFELAAGADARRIQLRYEGQDHLRIKDGALYVGTSVGTVVEQRPYAYQLRDGHPEPVACEYVLGAKNTVSFALPRGYDHSRPLVIDPVLVYASYTGSPANNWGYSSTFDAQGNLYCGGIAFTLGFPATLGAYSTSFAGNHDIAIMKFNPSATTGAASLLYATYLGGANTEHPHSMMADAAGNLVIYGTTSSTNYPTTPGAYDTSYNGVSDIVVTRLSATGSALLASTFVGGSLGDGQVFSGGLYKNFGDTYRGDLTIDRAGNVYVASSTQSSDFPRLIGVQNSLSGTRDAAVFKLTPGLTAMQWSTFLGGSNEDAAYSIQLDSLNNVFVCGGTMSNNFPGTAAGLRPTYGGGITDGFVARIAAAGNDLAQSTYLGTTGYDQAYFLQLDRQGQVYVLGQTDGAYPVSTGVYSNPNSLQFIHKIRPSLTAGTWSTVVGNGRVGPTNISPTAFLVSDCGQILLSGYGSNIDNMPVTPNAIKLTPTFPGMNGTNGDFYIMQLSANAGQLVYGTYYGNGGLHVDGGASRFDKSGVIYQTVCASGGAFGGPTAIPATTTPNAWSAVPGNTLRNALAFKIDVAQLSATFVPALTATSTIRQANLCAPATFYFNRPAATGTSTRWDFGNGQTSTQANNATTTYTQPGRYAVRLTVFDTNNCLQSVSTVDTVVVYAVPQPRVDPASRQALCGGSSITLSATNLATGTPNVTYTWTAPGMPTLTGASVTITPTTTVRYTVTARTPTAVGGCAGTDTVTVRVGTRLVVSAGPARTICPGAPVTLSVPSAGLGATYTWTAPGQPTLTSPSITVSPTASVRYLVRVVSATGCLGRDSVQINVAPRPVVAATASTPSLINNPVSFINTTTGATSYRWDFGDNTPPSTEVNPSHTYATATTTAPYQVRLTAVYGPGCEESILVPVRVRGFDLPNVITPNGDGLNDTFRPFVTTQAIDIQVFNRWGRLVYEQRNYGGNWGSDAATTPGVYYYRLLNTNGESWKGWLEVVK
jgi:gliding motility-associated-like protein